MGRAVEVFCRCSVSLKVGPRPWTWGVAGGRWPSAAVVSGVTHPDYLCPLPPRVWTPGLTEPIPTRLCPLPPQAWTPGLTEPISTRLCPLPPWAWTPGLTEPPVP